MADTRIRIARDKADLLKALKQDSSDVNGPFQTFADIVAFAALLGAKRNKRTPFDEVSSNPDPIPQDHFISRKYGKIIDLLAVMATGTPKILADNDISEGERIRIFEEFANTGLEIISSHLSGSVDYMEQILLLLQNEKFNYLSSDDRFDLSSFLSP